MESGARSGRAPAPVPARADVAGPESSPGDLLCASCRARITHEDHRVERGGAHAHTFVNPGGVVHRIGCFALAVHLSYVGDPETAFTWFPGFSWQVADCATCRSHLGWIYRCRGDQFHGLLLDKLARR